MRLLFASGLLALCAGAALPGHVVARPLRTTGTVVDQGPRSIVGKPYAATIEVKTVQTLPDGTHITREGIARKEYRDSQGRTRIEYYMLKGSGSADEGKLMSVIIRDPAKDASYLLNPRNHTAQKMIPRPAGQEGSFVVGSFRELEPPTVEDLGTRTIEGIPAEGKRITRTIPVGAVGNDRPIQITTERWFSNDLEINVLVKTSDPRQGESVTRTTNIDRSEPEPALF